MVSPMNESSKQQVQEFCFDFLSFLFAVFSLLPCVDAQPTLIDHVLPVEFSAKKSNYKEKRRRNCVLVLASFMKICKSFLFFFFSPFNLAAISACLDSPDT
jgi:hypothetical protein